MEIDNPSCYLLDSGAAAMVMPKVSKKALDTMMASMGGRITARGKENMDNTEQIAGACRGQLGEHHAHGRMRHHQSL